MSKLLERHLTAAMESAGARALDDGAALDEVFGVMHDAAPGLGQGEAVGEIRQHGDGFLMSVHFFNQPCLPAGTKLYAHPQPDQAARIKKMEEALRQVRSVASPSLAVSYPNGAAAKILTITGKALNLSERGE
jgi:hypothetical protein